MPEFFGQTMKDPQGFLTIEQVKKLIEAPRNLRDRVFLRLLYTSGRRVGEILLLKWSDILWEQNVIIFNILKRKQPRRERIPAPTKTIDSLKIYKRELENDRINLKKGKKERVFPITSRYAYDIVRMAGKRAGIERVGSKPIHPHHFRHSFAHHYIEGGGKAEQLQKILCHASIDSTTSYYTPSTSELRRELNKRMRFDEI